MGNVTYVCGCYTGHAKLRLASHRGQRLNLLPVLTIKQDFVVAVVVFNLT